MSEIAYIIERADPRNPGCVMPESFLGLTGSTAHPASGDLEWQPTAQ